MKDSWFVCGLLSYCWRLLAHLRRIPYAWRLPTGRLSSAWTWFSRPRRVPFCVWLIRSPSKESLCWTSLISDFSIHNQEPLLGQTLGLSASKNGHGEGYNWILGEFLQNGSVGRRINVEVRAYDEGVAFRYLIPRSPALETIVIESEETEFRFVQDASLPKYQDDLPLTVEQSGVGWVAITEAPLAGFPNMLLDRSDGRTMKVHLGAAKDKWPVESTAPLTSSWRVLLIGSSAAELNRSRMVERLR